jgi:hypothetical protein
LLFLAVSKAIDLRAHCEIWFRQFARATGWWDRRQPVQFFLAIVLPAVAGLLLGALTFSRARRFSRQYPVAVLGWFLIYLYLAFRQSLEWKPALAWLVSIGYFSWRLLLETGGLLLLTAVALRAARPGKSLGIL